MICSKESYIMKNDLIRKPDIKKEIKRRLKENDRHVYQKDIDFIVDQVFSIIQEEVENGNKIQITGFGSFSSTDVKRYYGRDPQKPTNVIAIPAHKRVTFSSGKVFKDRINNK